MAVYENPSIKYYKLNLITLAKESLDSFKEKEGIAKYENSSPTKKWKIIYKTENNRLIPYISKNDESLQIKLDAAYAIWMPFLSTKPANHTTKNP